MTSRLYIVLVVLVGACSVGRFPPPAPPRQTNLGITISTTTLANGQRVVLVKDPYAIDVQVTMRYQVGAVDDLDQPGMAHFVEHLMFQQVIDGQPLFTHLEDTASFFNANTSFDATTYVSRAPAAQLDKLLELEAARLTLRCETITEEAFAREREVVINEIKERDVSSETYTALHGALYPKQHPYRQSIGGSVQSVGAISRKEACAFIDTYYSPSNSVLVVSGAIGDRAPAALAKLATGVTKRVAASSRTVAPVTAAAPHAAVSAPLDDDIQILAWPLPVEPELQTRVRAIAAALPRLIDSEIEGAVVAIELGDRRAPLYGIAILPADTETIIGVTQAAYRAIEKLPGVLQGSGSPDDVLFERIRQGAIYGVYSGLEDGSDRDTRLAAYVLAGREPSAALASDLAVLRGLTRQHAVAIANQYLGVRAPTVVTLKATEGKKRGQSVALRKPVHDMRQRRTPPDPMLAKQPAAGAAPRTIVGGKTRVLPNGLKIVMLPVGSVPTVDVRLVFGTGTADEPVTHRGIATLTAQALSWDLRYLRDLMAFAAAGGMKSADVGTDRTTFSVQGMDSEVHVLLAGLRRWILDGTFDEDSAKFVVEMRRASTRRDEDAPLTDSWRAALFGAQHPYAQAGLVRHANMMLTLDHAAEFRTRHYTPSNATLVIAGSFDPALVDRWVDYLFADWRGTSTQRATARSAPQPASIAKVDDLTMVQLRIALPATSSNRAEQLVAAEMLSEIARDVRFQLGASYTVDAYLSEYRLARHYVIAGFIDAARSAAALKLIVERIQRLRSDPETAARAFVTARKHVIAQLLARVGSAESLASRVELDVALEREPMSDVVTAAAVQALTIERMTATLADFDLARAPVLMRGPEGDMRSAFDVLGRKPSYMAANPFDASAAVAPPSATNAPIGTIAPPVRVSEVQPSLTEPAPPRLALAVGVRAALTRFTEGPSTWSSLGKGVRAVVGYRYTLRSMIGGRVSIAQAGGQYNEIPGADYAYSVVPIDVGAYWAYAYNKRRSWIEASLGLHLDHVSDSMPSRTHAGVGYGLAIGTNMLKVGTGHIAVWVGLDGMSFRTSSNGSVSYSLGLEYRR
ncbi:MAG TPA: insulinase family protein [Kofleriaceae bacterium]